MANRKQPGSVSMLVRFWANEDGSIQLVSEDGEGLRATIKNDPQRPSGHPTLFRQMAKHLKQSAA